MHILVGKLKLPYMKYIVFSSICSQGVRLCREVAVCQRYVDCHVQCVTYVSAVLVQKSPLLV